MKNTKIYLKEENNMNINKYCISCYHNKQCSKCSLNTNDYTISQDIEYKNHMEYLKNSERDYWGI